MFLSQAMNADRSCQNIVNEIAVQDASLGFAPRNTHTGSYCKARQRLSFDVISTLASQVGSSISQNLPASWHWLGRKVKLIDGTTLTMPDTPENQAVYPQQKGQAEGIGFPICRVVAVICLSGGGIIDSKIAAYRGKGTGENTSFRQLLGSFEEGDIVLGDAIYAGYFSLAELVHRGIDGVFEQNGSRKKSTDFTKGKSLGAKDHLVTYEKPRKKPEWMSEAQYLAAPATLTLRELKVKGKILVTTLLSAIHYPKQSLNELYKSRWNVELDLRNIKETLGMSTLSCKTPDMIEKEIWVYFLAYNLIRTVMAQSAMSGNLVARQLSFKHTLQILRAWCQQSVSPENDGGIGDLFRLIIQNRVGDRPGRIEPRAVKRRPKPYPLLMKKRARAREDVKQFGHPKKQK
jgi:hypothetical protein